EIKTVEFIDGVQIDRNGDKLAIDTGQDFVLVLAPFRKTTEIIENFASICVENVRTVFMDQDARVVILIECVPGNMRPAVHEQHLFTRAAGETLRQNRAGETCSND